MSNVIFELLYKQYYSFRSKDQKCTKPQSCISGTCTWNQRLVFFDIDTLDNLSLWVKLVDLDRNQENLGEVNILQNKTTKN